MIRHLLLLGVFATACKKTDTDAVVARGRGLEVAVLRPGEEAAVLGAAIRAAFDVGPGLALYLEPRRLPRTAGYSGGDSIAPALASALRGAGLVRGTCDPMRDAPPSPPRCDVTEPGYLIRTSEVLRVGTDTLQIYFAAERFATKAGPRQPPFQFEKIYQLTRGGDSWRVVREARVTSDQT